MLTMCEGSLAVMYQYSRAIYRSIKDSIDPYADSKTRLEYRRAVLSACENTVERLVQDSYYFARPERALFQEIRRYFPIASQAQVSWTVAEGIGAASEFIEEQIRKGVLDDRVSECKAMTRKGRPCQRAPLSENDYCPSHQHLATSRAAA